MKPRAKTQPSNASEPVDRRRRRWEPKRARIVAEVWHLARRDGLAAISLREVADRVDLQQPSLYGYLPAIGVSDLDTAEVFTGMTAGFAH